MRSNDPDQQTRGIAPPIAVLAVDDDPSQHAILDRILPEGGPFALSHATSPETARAMVEAGNFPVALVDLHYANSASDGFGLLRELRDLDPAMELVVLSSATAFEDVRGAMQAGASDYLPKGFGRGELLHALERALERRRWRRIERNARRRAESGGQGRLLGASKAMQTVRERIEKFGPAEVPVLIFGETGTGKELAAAGLHAHGREPAGPFVPVNCAALPASTVDAFFFGHEKGAFTGADRARPGVFEEADGGTLFLDEVNSLPLDLQGRLLRVLQERRVRRLGSARERAVDFRLVAASNQPLEALVAKGAFREDLFFRLSVLRLELPPLRERREDIEGLCAAFAPDRKLQPELHELLRGHAWPGNVRELKNLLLAMDVLASPGEVLGLEHLPELALRTFASSQTVDAAGEDLDLQGFVNERDNREREFLMRAYRGAGGNVSRMARLLSLDRSHLHQKLVRLGIHEPRR